MLRVLREKLIRLGRDEDGAALVVTLAVFMFMWLVCAGVFAVGTAVKTRIHLQNACDAAAYSAAVVQADTLSRIATINRAMSWTYVQMTRRQMDYIVYKWLRHTVHHYENDRRTAKEWYNRGTRCPLHSWWQMWSDSEPRPSKNGRNQYSSDKVTLNGSEDDVALGVINNTCGRFLGQLSTAARSFYSTGGSWDEGRMRNQIRDDKVTIRAMNNAERILARSLSGHIRRVATNVFDANVPEFLREGCGRPLIQQSENPLNDYLSRLCNNARDELRFLAFCPQYEENALRRIFGAGIDRWFVRGNGVISTEGNDSGIQRSYRCWNRGILHSDWNWSAAYSVCVWIPPTLTTGGYWQHQQSVIRENMIPRCSHGHDFDQCVSSTNAYDACCYGDNSGSGAPVCMVPLSHIGEKAEPLVLRGSYFSDAGTITVGVSVRNQNPWSVVMGNIGSGIYAAFNPFVENTVVFASAKAGYKYLGDSPQSRGYRIDWNGDHQDWNLCQSDWDAVLIPVRMAQSRAINGRWVGVGRFLYGWVSALGVDPDRVFAGGTETPPKEDAKAFNEWKQMGATPYRTHRVNARWRVQNNAKTVGWDELTDRMFH